ncbi:aminotransferase class V-fold PLP-dependent enzyme [Chloroflexota bacterium]
MKRSEKPIYLDYNATTPIDPGVRNAMLPYLEKYFGNPSSSYVYGQRAREAVEKARGPELLAELMAPNQEIIEKRIYRQVPSDVIKQLGRFDDAEILAAKVVAARQEVEDMQKQLNQLDRADTRERQREQITDLKKALEESNNELRNIEEERSKRKVKYLWTPEIREKLWEAIKTAQERILILSGWISSEVLNIAMLEELRKTLKRGVKIWIGYGLDGESRRGKEQRERPNWKQAEASLSQLQKEFPNQLVYIDIGRNHEKRLICDNRFTFGGSFNLLSFSGERRGNSKVRHEGADLIENPEFCEQRWNYYLKEFFA